MPPENLNCVLGVQNKERIVALERDMHDIKGDIRDIKDTLLKRPSWAVTITIGLLMSALTASITVIGILMRYMATRGM